MSKKKIIIGLVSVIVLLIIFISIKKEAGWGSKEAEITVSTEKATRRFIKETVSADGKIQPEVEVKISPDVSGEIVELYVKEGSQVIAGTLLLKINPDIYQSVTERAEAALNTSKANLSNSKARVEQTKAQLLKTEINFKRNKRLWEEKAISDAEFEEIETAFQIAKSDLIAAKETVNAARFTIKSAEATLKEAKDNLLKTTIFAPISGTVYKLSVEKGERVVGTTQMAGTEMMRIADLNAMEVSVEVNENDIIRVKPGNIVEIEVDAYLNRKFIGSITEIANSATQRGMDLDQVTNFNVKIRILQTSYEDLIDTVQNIYPFRPGMSAGVEIQTETIEDALAIPIQAVTTRDSSDLFKTKKKSGRSASETQAEEDKKNDLKIQEYVFVIKNDKAKLVKVQSGIQDDSYIQILSGLDENTEVITSPYTAISKRLHDESPVKIVKKEDLFKLDD